MTPLDWVTDGDPEDVKRVSQEFRLTSKNNEKLDWIAGLYYYYQKTDNKSFVNLGEDISALGLPPVDMGSSGLLKTNSYAVFGNITYHFTPKLDVTIGGRYTYEEKDINYSQVDPFGLLGGTVDGLTASDHWGAFTPSLNIRYFITPEAMVYATNSRGFKSGGFNDALGDANGLSYNPEFIWSWEVGTKTSWLDNRLRVNADVFYMKWEDIQLVSDDPNTPAYDPRTSNAGKAHSKGIEIDIIAVPAERLELGLNAAFIDAQYDEGVLPTGPGSPGLPLKDLARVPNTHIGVNAQYTVPMGPVNLVMRGDYSYQHGSNLVLTGDPDGEVGNVSLLNTRLSLKEADGKWSISAWAKNLANKTYKVRLFDLSSTPLAGQKLIMLAPPRTYGIEAKLNF